MLIPNYSRYDLAENGTIIETMKNGSTRIVPEYREIRGYRAVKLQRDGNYFKNVFRLDRLLLKCFKPYRNDINYDTNLLSVTYLDNNRDNVELNNLQWNDVWYYPPGIPGKTCPYGTWFKVFGNEELEITFTNKWEIRSSLTRVHAKIVPDPKVGYESVRIYPYPTMFLHRLIGLTFLKHPINPDHLQINHIDHVRHHNFLENLEWVSPTGNMTEARQRGDLRFYGSRIQAFNLDTKQVTSYRSITEAATALGFYHSDLWRVINDSARIDRKHKNYLFKHKDDPVSWEELEKGITTNFPTKNVREDYVGVDGKIAVKDMRSGQIEIYNSAWFTSKEEKITMAELRYRLSEPVPIPYKGKCYRHYFNKELIWPDYPLELVDAYDRTRRQSWVLLVVHEDGSSKYYSSLQEWHNEYKPNVLLNSLSSYFYQLKTRTWRDWTFNIVDPRDYT